MSKENDDAVLRAIGQLTCKVDYDDPKAIKTLIGLVKKSPDFQLSTYGRKSLGLLQERLQKLSAEAETGDVGSAAVADHIRRSDEKTEQLFQSIDESLFQVASQKTSRNTQRLVWIVLAFVVADTVAILFVALFLWKLNMGGDSSTETALLQVLSLLQI